MKYFLLLIAIISTYGVLEHYALIPSQPYGVLSSLEIIASFIKSLHTIPNPLSKSLAIINYSRL